MRLIFFLGIVRPCKKLRAILNSSSQCRSCNAVTHTKIRCIALTTESFPNLSNSIGMLSGFAAFSLFMDLSAFSFFLLLELALLEQFPNHMYHCQCWCTGSRNTLATFPICQRSLSVCHRFGQKSLILGHAFFVKRSTVENKFLTCFFASFLNFFAYAA